MSRRRFIETIGVGCGAHLAGMAFPGLPRLSIPPRWAGAISGVEPWGSYQELVPGVWAALDSGNDLAEAAARCRSPVASGEWALFSSTYYRTAFEAWRRELHDPNPLGGPVSTSGPAV